MYMTAGKATRHFYTDIIMPEGVTKTFIEIAI